jgi:hypothetical protein
MDADMANHVEIPRSNHARKGRATKATIATQLPKAAKSFGILRRFRVVTK